MGCHASVLQDPEESNQDTDKRLNDQFAHLTNLLKDAVPEVRVAAVQGVCRILNEYWELIPGTVTAGYIKLMAGGALLLLLLLFGAGLTWLKPQAVC